VGDRYYEATTLAPLGDIHHDTGDRHAAQQAWQQALTILDELGRADADRVRDRLHHLDRAVVAGAVVAESPASLAEGPGRSPTT
jgi:hypothetical protein